jgi:excisionase family DNA binding protein
MQTDTPRSDQMLTVAEVADVLHVSRETGYALIRDGRLPAAQLGPPDGGVRSKLLRVRRADLDRFVDEQIVASQPHGGEAA